MAMTKSDFISDLSRFADIDSKIVITSTGEKYNAKFNQNGDSVVLNISKDGSEVIEARNGAKKKHNTYRGLLASPNFGNLKRLAESQKTQIRQESPYIENIEQHLPVSGKLSSALEKTQNSSDIFSAVDSWLGNSLPELSSVRALVIDGPAGIGKTHLIRRLVHSRAHAYGPGSYPPVLHIQSRGRRLVTLNDVLAGTLQTLRISLMYDQVPVLVRHGLLQIAIDGFDELADPNGYETAWGSLRDFIEELGGKGVLILAGRDTFINVESIKKAIPLLDTPSTEAAHLKTLAPEDARQWFIKIGWQPDRVSLIEEAGLLEEDSYALRPFFISKIAEISKTKKAFERFVEFPLHALISSMIEREARLVIKSVNLEIAEIVRLFQEILMEVARDMADGESDSIDETALDLIAEMVLGEHIPEEQLAVLRHKIKSFTLLEGEARTSARHFPHTEISDYFLGLAYIDLLSKGEVSKSLRRGIIGTDFLETFHDITIAHEKEKVRDFFDKANLVLARRDTEDRGGRNISALILASLPAGFESPRTHSLSNQSLDEALLRGDMPAFSITTTDISQLDARGANLMAMSMSNSSINTMVVDATTRLPLTWPMPRILKIDDDVRSLLTIPSEIQAWISKHSFSFPSDPSQDRDHSILFERICRATLRQFWIRATGDDPAARLLARPQWQAIKPILERHNLLKVRKNVATGGPKSDFYRIERAREFLDPSSKDEVITRVIQEIASRDY